MSTSPFRPANRRPREAGDADTMTMMERSPWREPADPIECVVEHR